MILARWNVAKGSNYHCIGYWSLTINEIDYSDYIPIEKRTGPMGTLIDHCERKANHYIHHYSGKTFNEWYPDNHWVDKLPVAPLRVYNAIREYDWACGACAYCVKIQKRLKNGLE